MTLDRRIVAELEAIVGAEHGGTDRGHVEPYARDATPVLGAVPDALVWPATTEQVAGGRPLPRGRRCRVPRVPSAPRRDSRTAGASGTPAGRSA